MKGLKIFYLENKPMERKIKKMKYVENVLPFHFLNLKNKYVKEYGWVDLRIQRVNTQERRGILF